MFGVSTRSCQPDFDIWCSWLECRRGCGSNWGFDYTSPFWASINLNLALAWGWAAGAVNGCEFNTASEPDSGNLAQAQAAAERDRGSTNMPYEVTTSCGMDKLGVAHHCRSLSVQFDQYDPLTWSTGRKRARAAFATERVIFYWYLQCRDDPACPLAWSGFQRQQKVHLSIQSYKQVNYHTSDPETQ